MTKMDAAKFIFQCQNWPEVILPIARHQPPGRIMLKDGLRFESHALYWADIYTILQQHIYTPAFLPIENNDVVVDIGANIGVFTIYAASRTQNTVYALEPSPENFRALSQNVAANQAPNVVTLQFAISDHSGMEAFSTTGQSQHHRLQKMTFERSTTSIEVPTVTLADLMSQQKIDCIDFLKLDCEGGEEMIIRTTPRSALQRVRKIALEFHDHLTTVNHDELRALLEEAGFTTQLTWDGTSVLGFLYAWRARNN